MPDHKRVLRHAELAPYLLPAELELGIQGEAGGGHAAKCAER
jgi:hypothetical protein